MPSRKVFLLSSNEQNEADIDRDNVLQQLDSTDDDLVLNQLETIISWTLHDGISAKLRSFELVPKLLKLLSHSNEQIVETAASSMSYLSGRSGAGPYYRHWSFQLEGHQHKENEEQKVVLSIYEPSYSSGAGLGWKTWNAAVVLVEYLGLHPDAFIDQDILELGCGTGLSGIFCAKFGAKHVLMTDYNEKVLETVAINLTRNSLSNVSTKRLDWNELIQAVSSRILGNDLVLQHCHETIIGSDIVYDPEHAEIVPRVLDTLLAHSPNARIYIAIGPRPEAPQFMHIMKHQYHFELEQHLEHNYIDASSIYFHHDLLVYKRPSSESQ